MPLLTTGAGSYPAIGGDAAETTAFLARTSGLSGTETNAYKALINGLVADGNFSRLDALYIFATNTTTTANLNLCSTSYGLTQSGSLTFTADVGYTGNGSNGYLTAAFNPTTAGSPNYILNSASIGGYILNNRTTDADVALISCRDGSNQAWILPKRSGATLYNVNNASNVAPAATTAQGFWVATRTASNLTTLYRNGTSFNTDANASTALPNSNTFIFQDAFGARFSSDQVSAAFMGGGLSSGQMTSVSNRINGYMTALSINVY